MCLFLLSVVINFTSVLAMFLLLVAEQVPLGGGDMLVMVFFSAVALIVGTMSLGAHTPCSASTVLLTIISYSSSLLKSTPGQWFGNPAMQNSSCQFLLAEVNQDEVQLWPHYKTYFNQRVCDYLVLFFYNLE